MIDKEIYKSLLYCSINKGVLIGVFSGILLILSIECFWSKDFSYLGGLVFLLSILIFFVGRFVALKPLFDDEESEKENYFGEDEEIIDEDEDLEEDNGDENEPQNQL